MKKFHIMALPQHIHIVHTYIHGAGMLVMVMVPPTLSGEEQRRNTAFYENTRLPTCRTHCMNSHEHGATQVQSYEHVVRAQQQWVVVYIYIRREPNSAVIPFSFPSCHYSAVPVVCTACCTTLPTRILLAIYYHDETTWRQDQKHHYLRVYDIREVLILAVFDTHHNHQAAFRTHVVYMRRTYTHTYAVSCWYPTVGNKRQSRSQVSTLTRSQRERIKIARRDCLLVYVYTTLLWCVSMHTCLRVYTT